MGSKHCLQAKGRSARRLQTAKAGKYNRDKQSASNVVVDISPSHNATASQSLSLRDLNTREDGYKYSKRSRQFGTITPHACANCRKKRAKCDGQTPCGRCKLKETECIYKATVSQSKAQLRAELYTLRQRQHTLEQLVAAVTRPDHCQDALARIQSRKNMDCNSRLVNSSLASGSCATDMIDSGIKSCTNHTQGEPREPIDRNPKVDSPTLDVNQHQDMEDATGTKEPQYAALGPLSQCSQSTWYWDAHILDSREEAPRKWQGLPLNELLVVPSSETWTRMTDDMELTRHLLALYFCWEYPNFAPISKEHFLQDFQERRHRYCSPMLVNALLSLGFYLSDRPLTALGDSSMSGDIFFEEARRLLLLTSDKHSITTIQAVVIMSIRESRCNRLSESRYYAEQAMRLAVEMGLHVCVGGCGNESAVQAKTFWGAFTLNQAWSLVTGTLPQCSYSLHLPPKPAITIDVETSTWVPYVDGDAKLQPFVQLSNVRSVYQCFCTLNEAVHQSLYVLSAPDTSLSAANVLQIYYCYLHWYDQLPEGMRLGHNSTPAVLFTHLYYHFALLLLFRPFSKLRLIGTHIGPREVCSQAASAIQSLVTSYAKLYTLRRTPTFMPYFTFASATTRLAIDSTSTRSDPSRSSPYKHSIANTEVYNAIRLDIAHLAAMAPYHSFANHALHILRCRAHEWNPQVDIDRNTTPLEKSAKPHHVNLSISAPDIISECPTCNAELENTIAAEGTRTPACNMEPLLPALFQLLEKSTVPQESELEQAGFALL